MNVYIHQVDDGLGAADTWDEILDGQAGHAQAHPTFGHGRKRQSGLVPEARFIERRIRAVANSREARNVLL
jgi:hypothetical protein